jgi:O-antigen ligase
MVRPSIVTWLLLGLQLVLFLGVLYSPAPVYGVYKAKLFLLLGLGVHWLGMALFRNIREARKTITAIAVVGAVFCLMVATGYTFHARVVEESARLGVTLGEGGELIRFGRDMSLAAMSMFVILFSTKYKVMQFVALGFIVAESYMVLLSGSRGPALGLIFALLVFIVMGHKKRSRVAILAVGVICIAFLAIHFASQVGLPRLWQRTYEDISLRQSDRFPLFELALKMGREAPLTGKGTGSFGYHFSGMDIQVYPHNPFFETFSENGVGGLILVALIYVYVVRHVLQISARREIPLAVRQFAIALFALSVTNAMGSNDLALNPVFFFSTGALAGLAGRASPGLLTNKAAGWGWLRYRLALPGRVRRADACAAALAMGGGNRHACGSRVVSRLSKGNLVPARPRVTATSYE